MFEEVQTNEEKPIAEVFARFAESFYELVRHSQCPESLAGAVIDALMEQTRDIHDCADMVRLQLVDLGKQIGDGREIEAEEVIQFHPELVV